MKQRLDQLLVDRGLAVSRSQAQALIMAGAVSTEGRRLDKSGQQVSDDIVLQVRDQPRYASRAGDKLASVAERLGLDFTGQRVLDVGSSTGGFTDFALQHGARLVYCVDVGTNQLAYRLRQDERVVVMERTDIRDVRIGSAASTVSILEQVDMAVMDVSFVSLTKVLPAVGALVRTGGVVVAMVKPQFEAGKAIADRYKGVIPLGAVRDGILDDFRLWLAQEGWTIVDEVDSAVAGAQGNVERFFKLLKAAS